MWMYGLAPNAWSFNISLNAGEFVGCLWKYDERKCQVLALYQRFGIPKRNCIFAMKCCFSNLNQGLSGFFFGGGG
jgi:hypothetical protein